MTIKPGCEVTMTRQHCSTRRSSVLLRHISNGKEHSTALPVVVVVGALWVKAQSQVDERSDGETHT